MTEQLTRHSRLRRQGRALIVELLAPHLVLSSAVHGGGQRRDLTHLINHQICEGVGHDEICASMQDLGDAAYHAALCKEFALPAATSVHLSTAANMACSAVETVEDEDLNVVAVATAGVASNATRAGDPTRWRESRHESKPAPAGTINVMLLCNQTLSEGALTTAAMVLTEAKSTALLDWRFPSRQSNGLATGTGTDQFLIAAPETQSEADWPRRWAGTHHKLGELIAQATYRAVRRGIEQQNGSSATHRRSALAALGRFGLDEHGIVTACEQLDGPTELLTKNLLALIHDPGCAAAAYAAAEVTSLGQAGLLPPETVLEAQRNQAVLLAEAAAFKPLPRPEVLQALGEASDIATLAARALAIGFARRWDR